MLYDVTAAIETFVHPSENPTCHSRRAWKAERGGQHLESGRINTLLNGKNSTLWPWAQVRLNATKMAQEIDWLHSQAGVCKVNHFSPEGQKDQDRKMICFVDVSSITMKDKDQRALSEIDLGSLEEKEVIVIRDNEKNNPSNTEGAVCLFKQGSSEEINVVSWLSNDLQKYAIGFQHALTPASRKSNPYTVSADKLPQISTGTGTGTGGQRGSVDDSSYYVNKLCSMVVQKARQEIKDKLEGGGKSVRQIVNGSDSKIAAPVTQDGSEKPWSMDVHAKDIFGMALKMIQQHLIEKTKDISREANATSSGYPPRDANYERPGGSQTGKYPTGAGGLQESPPHESPKASISGILLSLVQKILRDAASGFDDRSNDTNRACKQGPPS